MTGGRGPQKKAEPDETECISEEAACNTEVDDIQNTSVCEMSV